MAKRGRRSAAELSITTEGRGSIALHRRSTSTQARRNSFESWLRPARQNISCVQICRFGELRPGDASLKASCDGSGKDAAMIGVWEKATRMQATLATRLRLAPQARPIRKQFPPVRQSPALCL